MLLQISQQDWARLVETQHMKVKNDSVTCTSGAILPWENLCQWVCPSSPRAACVTFILPLNADSPLIFWQETVHLSCFTYLQPSSRSANKAVFAAFLVGVGFVACCPEEQGSYWDLQPPQHASAQSKHLLWTNQIQHPAAIPQEHRESILSPHRVRDTQVSSIFSQSHRNWMQNKTQAIHCA